MDSKAFENAFEMALKKMRNYVSLSAWEARQPGLFPFPPVKPMSPSLPQLLSAAGLAPPLPES